MGAADSRAGGKGDAGRAASSGYGCRTCTVGEDICDTFDPVGEDRERWEPSRFEVRGGLVEESIGSASLAQVRALSVLADDRCCRRFEATHVAAKSVSYECQWQEEDTDLQPLAASSGPWQGQKKCWPQQGSRAPGKENLLYAPVLPQGSSQGRRPWKEDAAPASLHRQQQQQQQFRPLEGFRAIDTENSSCGALPIGSSQARRAFSMLTDDLLTGRDTHCGASCVWSDESDAAKGLTHECQWSEVDMEPLRGREVARPYITSPAHLPERHWSLESDITKAEVRTRSPSPGEESYGSAPAADQRLGHASQHAEEKIRKMQDMLRIAPGAAGSGNLQQDANAKMEHLRCRIDRLAASQKPVGAVR